MLRLVCAGFPYVRVVNEGYEFPQDYDCMLSSDSVVKYFISAGTRGCFVSVRTLELSPVVFLFCFSTYRQSTVAAVIFSSRYRFPNTCVGAMVRPD